MQIEQYVYRSFTIGVSINGQERIRMAMLPLLYFVSITQTEKIPMG